MHSRFPAATAVVLVLALSGANLPVLAQQPEQPSQSKPAAPPDPGPQPDGQVPGPNAILPQHRATHPEGQTQAQPVPGAMPGGESVPSTISERNAASDKLITVAFAFKHLTDEQRQAIYQALKKSPPGKAFNAEVGVVLPPEVELQPVPKEVQTRVPDTSGYQFAVAADRILLVSPANRVVVGVVTQ
jgi:hypothetical protein